MKYYTYCDGLGHEYKVPESVMPEFERRRGICLRIAVFIEILILVALMAF
jgi:hypothetical protein